MDWIKASIFTTSEGIEPLCGRLYAAGISGVEIEDKDDFFDFLENNRQCWDYVDDELVAAISPEPCVKVYIADNASGLDTLRLVRETVGQMKDGDTERRFGRLDILLDNISEDDWANNWKQYFKPIAIGEKILIKPEWEVLSEKTDRIIFSVNPGMTFGTGTHETTKMCVCALERYVKPGDRVLDIGCGSGILSIISLLLGANTATAVDIDPNCEEIALANARQNGIGDNRYTVMSGNVLADEKLKEKLGTGYDIVVANIVADVIIPLSAQVRRYMKDGGIFICSGIIDFRKDDVLAALLANGFEVIAEQCDGEWVAVSCQNPL